MGPITLIRYGWTGSDRSRRAVAYAAVQHCPVSSLCPLTDLQARPQIPTNTPLATTCLCLTQDTGEADLADTVPEVGPVSSNTPFATTTSSQGKRRSSQTIQMNSSRSSASGTLMPSSHAPIAEAISSTPLAEVAITPSSSSQTDSCLLALRSAPHTSAATATTRTPLRVSRLSPSPLLLAALSKPSVQHPGWHPLACAPVLNVIRRNATRTLRILMLSWYLLLHCCCPLRCSLLHYCLLRRCLLRSYCCCYPLLC